MDYPNQTSGSGLPVQVENVQYNVNVGRVRSKIGFAAFLMSLLVWMVAGVAILLLLSIRAKFFPMSNEDSVDFAGFTVLSISILVPVVPLLWYLMRRIRKILTENPATVEDLFFKKIVRFHLVVGIIFSVGWITVMVYNVLAKIFLHNQDIDKGAILDSVIFALVSSSVAFFFFRYQNMTKR